MLQFDWRRTLRCALVLMLGVLAMRRRIPARTAAYGYSFPSVRTNRRLGSAGVGRGGSSFSLAMAAQPTPKAATTLSPSDDYIFKKELEVKKSVFVARAKHVTNFKDAMKFLEKVRDLKASHNCWAVTLANDPMTSSRCSDDGEPASTAGKPILSALEGDNIVNTIVVVTRYFGGTELGKGGLIRAYGGVARDCLRDAEKVAIVQTQNLQVKCSINDIGKVYQAIGTIERTSKSHSIGLPVQKLEEEYVDDSVILKFRVEIDIIKEFEEIMKSLSHLIETERLGGGGSSVGENIS